MEWRDAADYLSAKYQSTRFKTRYYCRFGILLLQTVYNGVDDDSILGQLVFIGVIYLTWVLYSTGIYTALEIVEWFLPTLFGISVTLMITKEGGDEHE